MNNFGRSMNESKFHLVLFTPSTHLFQWSEIRLGLLLRRSVECKFCQTYHRLTILCLCGRLCCSMAVTVMNVE